MIIKLLFLLLSIGSSVYADVYSRSIFSTPTPFRQSSPELVAASRDQLIFGEEDYRTGITLTPFAGKSINSDALAKYFLPYSGKGAKTTLIAGEFGSAAADAGTLDLLAIYFDVLTNAWPADVGSFTKGDYQFQSELSFSPEQQFGGVNLSYRRHLSSHSDQGYWVDISAPFMVVKNDLKMTENIVATGGSTGSNPAVPTGYFGSMKDAFRQEDWNYGKIDGPQTKAGIADVTIRLGRIYSKEEHFFLNTYMGGIIPTGNKPTSEFLFEPTIGNLGHLGFVSGGSAGVKIWSRCDKSIYWMIDTAGTFLFENEQLRSLDLQNRPWSRYLGVFLNSTSTKATPGINVFTLPVKVNPGSIRDLNTSFVFKQGGFHAELGYHFYGRGVEDLSLAKTWESNVAIASNVTNVSTTSIISEIYRVGGNKLCKNGATINQYLEIKNNTESDGVTQVYKPLSDSEIDLESASHPAIISNTFYGSMGYHIGNTAHPLFVGAGGSVEFGADNAGMDKVMGWLKLEMSF